MSSVRKADGEKSLSQAVKKLKGEYQSLKQKSSTEFSAAIEDCKRVLGLAQHERHQ